MSSHRRSEHAKKNTAINNAIGVGYTDINLSFFNLGVLMIPMLFEDGPWKNSTCQDFCPDPHEFLDYRKLSLFSS